MKGISPVISIIIVLLITISLAAAAWTYISGYWGSLVGSNIEITAANCQGGVNATIYIHNIGTNRIDLKNNLDVTRTDGGSPSLVYNNGTEGGTLVEPGGTGKIIDTACTTIGVQKRCAYDILHLPSGRLYQTFVTCSG